MSIQADHGVAPRAEWLVLEAPLDLAMSLQNQCFPNGPFLFRIFRVFTRNATDDSRRLEKHGRGTTRHKLKRAELYYWTAAG